MASAHNSPKGKRKRASATSQGENPSKRPRGRGSGRPPSSKNGTRAAPTADDAVPGAQGSSTNPVAHSGAANGSTELAKNRLTTDSREDQGSAMRTSHDYEYSALPQDTIRILIVHPGDAKSELYCTLRNRRLRPLDAHGRPKRIEENGVEVELQPYEALSYSWQDQKPGHDIRISDSDHGNYKLNKITENLRDALVTLRHESKERHFWVDAVCMNQENLVEKSRQLPLMARIYSEASNVVVWLGLENEKENTSKAFDLMKKIRTLRDFEVLVEKKTDCDDWEAFIALMTRNWFSRRWVVQEITLASKATLHCGGREILWKSFAEAVALLEVMIDRVKEKFAGSTRNPDKFGDIKEFSASRLVRVTSNMVAKNDAGQVVQKMQSLEYLVTALTPFEAKSPHDIIYAVLSLAKDVSGSTVTEENKGNIEWTVDNVPPELLEGHRDPEGVLNTLKRASRLFKVDKFPVHYGKDFYQVCEDFLKFSTGQSKSLDMICRPWAPVALETSKALPSWIRTLADAPFGRDQNGHWDRQNANVLVGVPGQSPYEASGTYRSTWKFEMDEVAPLLTVQGFQLDVIERLEDPARAGVIPSSWLEYGDLKGKQFKPLEDNTETTSNVTESFWRTMVANKGPDGEAPPPHYAFLCEKTFTTIVKHGDVMLDRIHDRSEYTLQKAYIRRVQSVVWGRKLTKTARFLALVPKDTKEGDIIAIVFGISVPVVLRKRLSDDGEQFDLVGECYAHGAMAGEAFDIRNRMRDDQRSEIATAVIWDCGNRSFRIR